MRYAIVSDIHANAPAWEAVLEDIRGCGVDRVVCLGDVVGYGPHPADVFESVRANTNIIVLGNHDAAICGLMTTELFNPGARQILEWTRERLPSSAPVAMDAWPLTVKGQGFRCAHSEFWKPERFIYVIKPEDAMPSWKVVPEPLLFVGHLHKPGIHILGPSGVPRYVEAQDFVLEPEKRFLVNVGSIGQPRDHDPRACYALYDTEDKAVFFRRVPFDLELYRRDALAAGLPYVAFVFLPREMRPRFDGAPLLHEHEMFKPATTDDEAARIPAR